MDNLSEKYSVQTPYAYAANNPIRYIDVKRMGPGEVDQKKPGQNILVKALHTVEKMPLQSPPSGKDAIKMGVAFDVKVGETKIGSIGMGVAANSKKGIVVSGGGSLGNDIVGTAKAEMSAYAKGGKVVVESNIAVEGAGKPKQFDSDLIVPLPPAGFINLSEVKRDVQGLINTLGDFLSTVSEETTKPYKFVPNGNE